MAGKNCWEVKGCIHNPDIPKKNGRPVCPVARSGEFDGVNKGTFAGRFCWAVAGTFCEGQMQGLFPRKFVDCLHCEFFKQVDREEGRFLVLTPYEARQLTQEEEERKVSHG